jgi:glutamate dehydrogenase (NADP+)
MDQVVAKRSRSTVDEFMNQVVTKNPGEVEFHQAVREVVECVMPLVEDHPGYRKARILERMVEP